MLGKHSTDWAPFPAYIHLLIANLFPLWKLLILCPRRLNNTKSHHIHSEMTLTLKWHWLPLLGILAKSFLMAKCKERHQNLSYLASPCGFLLETLPVGPRFSSLPGPLHHSQSFAFAGCSASTQALTACVSQGSSYWSFSLLTLQTFFFYLNLSQYGTNSHNYL